jgi:tRNA pseudouridine38-40 synthase
MRRFALLLEYEGTRYAGSQFQNDQPTIQGALEQAVDAVTGEASRAAFAGRTDAGVHARGQVAAFNTSSRLQPDVLVRALNATLPDDVVVLGVAEVGPAFDPRRDAQSRWYRYSIRNTPPPSALQRRTTWHVPEPLDEQEMTAAARLLPGRRDFAPFCGAIEPGRTTVRTIHCALWSRRGTVLRFDVAGDAFLPQQVRRMVGALVRVGQGKMHRDEFAATLESGSHGASNHLAPPHGLCLVGVSYPDLNFGVGNDENV